MVASLIAAVVVAVAWIVFAVYVLMQLEDFSHVNIHQNSLLWETEGVNVFICVSSLIGLLFGLFQVYALTRVKVGAVTSGGLDEPLKNREDFIDFNEAEGKPYHENWAAAVASLNHIGKCINEGATAFLVAEYQIIGIFVVVFCVIIALLVEEELGQFWTTTAFVLGAATSVVSGFIGMKVAVYANKRTAYSATNPNTGLADAFKVAFRGGSVLGFCLSGLGLLNLWILILCYRAFYLDDDYTMEDLQKMLETIAGYGFGGSTIALFGRVGGGIYTKVADVGADLAGKVEEGLEEDDPRNPATIADNVGDNVGDIAGMGADLFGSFAESTCAALVVCSTSPELLSSTGAMMYPLLLSASGILVSLVTAFFATDVMKVDKESKIERTLKFQLIISTVLLTPTLFLISWWVLPEEFSFTKMGGDENSETVIKGVKYWHAFICVAAGLWSGMIIGIFTEYYTSMAYGPVKKVADSCKIGAATNIIYGLALGYLSCIIPTFCLAFTIYFSFLLAGMYGIALSAIGMLSNLAISLTIDGYGPIADNAGGMVEMIHLRPEIREITDALDAAGNTTAAIGKGFAIGSAALVSLALFGAFITRSQLSGVNIMAPLEFTGLLIGAMIPYAFSGLTMKSVGKAANEMVVEVRRQFAEMRANPDF